MPYSQMELREIRRTFLRENRPGQYRRMRREGTLEDHLVERAQLAQRQHDRILAEGWTTIDDQAWSWAVRSELLESPWD